MPSQHKKSAVHPAGERNAGFPIRVHPCPSVVEIFLRSNPTSGFGFISVPLLRQESRRWHSKLCQKYPVAQIQQGFGNAESPVFPTFFARRRGWHGQS
jgi:hypothetical protein